MKTEPPMINRNHLYMGILSVAVVLSPALFTVEPPADGLFEDPFGDEGVGTTESAVVEEDVEAADAAVRASIGKLYRKAMLRQEKGDAQGALDAFMECLALWEEAAPHLIHPEKVGAMAKNCRKSIEMLHGTVRREALIGRTRELVRRLRLDRFAVENAEVGGVLELVRTEIGRLGKCVPPNLIVRVSKSSLSRRVTLDVRGLTAYAILELVTDQAGMEVRYERHSIVLVERQKAGEQ